MNSNPSHSPVNSYTFDFSISYILALNIPVSQSVTSVQVTLYRWSFSSNDNSIWSADHDATPSGLVWVFVWSVTFQHSRPVLNGLLEYLPV